MNRPAFADRHEARTTMQAPSQIRIGTIVSIFRMLSVIDLEFCAVKDCAREIPDDEHHDPPPSREVGDGLALRDGFPSEASDLFGWAKERAFGDVCGHGGVRHTGFKEDD